MGTAAVAQSASALGGLIRLAKARGAQSVLLQTWAYADGDPANRALFPDYPKMQACTLRCLARVSHSPLMSVSLSRSLFAVPTLLS